jgi:phycocyanobilin lyase subunit alpha
MSELTQSHFESELEPPNGEPLTVETALANLTHEDVSLRYYAAWWLGKFGAGNPGVVEALITAILCGAMRLVLWANWAIAVPFQSCFRL